MPLDPVCGMFVRDAPNAVDAVVGGHRYLFCSRACLRRFTAPEREVAWMTRSAAFALGAGAVLVAVPALALLREPSLGLFLLALGTAVQVLAGLPFYQGIRHALAARAPTMDTLIALGTTAAWLFGALEVLRPELLVPGRQVYYFEVAALVLGFVCAGRALEQRMRGRATHQVQKLLELQPSTARVVRGAREEEVAVEEIRAEDVVVVRPGERVPVDGVVVQGRGAVDEKLLTGESLPADKQPGDKVIGGSVNQGATLRVRAIEVGEASALGRIAALISEAQTTAPHGKRLADALSARFVPLVLALAGLTFAGWYFLAGQALPLAFAAAVAVLLVACPAALGLATPTVLTVGVSRGAALGLLVKDAAVLERIQKVDVVVFDKTGTLTQGEPALTDIHPLRGDQRDLLSLAASAEHGSEHPLAKAVVRAARAQGADPREPEEFRAYAGVGVEAKVGRQDVLVGNLRLFADRRVDVQGAQDLLRRLQDEGKTVVLVARDDELAGLLAFSDPLRPEAVEAVQRLQAMGIEPALVTGDNARTAQAVARDTGISIKRVFAEITPHGKKGVVKALQDGGHTVALVGDGINDAPGLAAADVGIAIGGGAEVALGASDVVLLRGDPRDVPAGIALSQQTSAKVRQNLVWALSYNVVLIPAAMLGLLSPLLAGLAMAFSTVPVLANAARLARAWEASPAPAAAPVPHEHAARSLPVVGMATIKR